MLEWRNVYLKLLILCAGLMMLCGFGLALLLDSGSALVPWLGLAGILCGVLSGLCGILWLVSLWRQMRS